MSSLHAVAFVRDIHMHIYAVMNVLMLYFWIKLIMKMPKFLTAGWCSLSVTIDRIGFHQTFSMFDHGERAEDDDRVLLVA